MKTWLLLAMFTSTVMLSGCYTPLIEGAQQGYDGARREALEASAKAGNPVEQFKLGNTYCCQGAGPLHDMSIYDNVKATQWYCRSARQSYAPAQLQLARLYSGHAIRGFHLVLRASDLLGTDETNISVALMWASLAANQGEEDAVKLRDRINMQATANQRMRADTLIKEWRTAPCCWDDVIHATAKTTEK